MGNFPTAGKTPTPWPKRLDDARSILMRIKDEILMKIGEHKIPDGNAALQELTELLSLVEDAITTLSVNDQELIDAILDGKWPTSKLLE